MNADAVLDECRHEPRSLELGNGGRCCVNCWNAYRAAFRAERKVENAAAREAGRVYWAGRGLKPGDTIYTIGANFFGPVVIKGIAKVGWVGAYVSCPRHYGRKMLKPEYWTNKDPAP